MENNDREYYAIEEREGFCWFCNRRTKAVCFENDGKFAFVCSHCKGRGPSAKSADEAWEKYVGNK